ncbi:hypothetical protein BOX15_Mlig008344g1 [Macrostomum lignano]|uniref:EF-hand domain-containing protein n=2 Tax=Macrostomum lignano TaxID=282301 RepID=A0A1I8IF36_9PLAT|nr:hypothetical protein BOX15_Mlig008344g2 [Macrostomum lignano]PAA72255.1 hypothetical protein BOX15_Mlig008344g1 [Macrostomum lignano]
MTEEQDSKPILVSALTAPGMSAESATGATIAAVDKTGGEFDYRPSTTVFGHLKFIFKLWWRHLTMRVKVPKEDMEELKSSCLLDESQITRLYKQFQLLVNDSERAFLTVNDLESHSSLLAGNPLKKYIYRMLFWNREQLSFTAFVKSLSLTFSNCIGCPQMHLVKSLPDMCYFTGVTCPRDVAQMQKLLALYNCFDLKETGCLDTSSLCQLLYDLLRCDSDLSVSSLLPPSMISRMVNTAIANVHECFPRVCEDICGEHVVHRLSIGSQLGHIETRLKSFEGHQMLLTKELFIRDQEDLHLDQLMAMRV